VLNRRAEDQSRLLGRHSGVGRGLTGGGGDRKCRCGSGLGEKSKPARTSNHRSSAAMHGKGRAAGEQPGRRKKTDAAGRTGLTGALRSVGVLFTSKKIVPASRDCEVTSSHCALFLRARRGSRGAGGLLEAVGP